MQETILGFSKLTINIMLSNRLGLHMLEVDVLGQREKQYEQIKNDQGNIDFNDLTGFLEWLGFKRKNGNGSHISYLHPECKSPIGLVTPHGGENKVKRSYVRDVLSVIRDKCPGVLQRRGLLA